MTGSPGGRASHGPTPRGREPHDPVPRGPAPGGRAPRDRRIALLTGGRGTGKTTACRRLLERARDLELACAGIVSPARFEGGTKVGIDVLDVRTGECRALAEVDALPEADDVAGTDALAGADGLPGHLRLGPHRFDEAAIAWARSRLEAAGPCDVLVVDEIGPLELERGDGWANALGVLRDGDYRLAVAVVRPRLVGALRAALGDLPGTVVVERSVEVDGDPVGDLLELITGAGPGEMPLRG